MRSLPLIKFDNGPRYCDRGDSCVLRYSRSPFVFLKYVTVKHPNTYIGTYTLPAPFTMYQNSFPPKKTNVLLYMSKERILQLEKFLINYNLQLGDTPF